MIDFQGSYKAIIHQGQMGFCVKLYLVLCYRVIDMLCVRTPLFSLICLFDLLSHVYVHKSIEMEIILRRTISFFFLCQN